MGYTHYWRFNNIGIKASDLEERYQRAVKDCQKIVRYAHINGLVKLSGYTAHCKVGKYGGVVLNGTGDNAHENFYLREHFKQNEDFNFCKTAQKPYDIVVVACLAVLKHRLGDNIEVSTDGFLKDWVAGINLARTVTKLKIKNPITKE